jgi:hypothetical protein
MERGREEEAGIFASSGGHLEDVFGSAQYSQYGDFASVTESRDSNTSDSDYVTEDTSALKEYTDLSNKIVIENSIESIRNVIEVTNIPPMNRQIIEKSIDTLQTAIAISENSISDKEITNHGNTDLMPEFVRTGYPLIHLQDTEDSRMLMKKKNRKVSPISVEEERVREALGIPGKVNTQADIQSLYNTSFAGDRERNIMVKFFFSFLTHSLPNLFSPAQIIYFLIGLEYQLLKRKVP